ncbi:MAG: energy coupling factor transporter S component ThiW [Ruminococcaceae bacterium]|nr:energy coupling factor transporter S component ThiW [Oscillospiraceae bacterium]
MKQIHLKKMVFTALLASLGYVLSTFVYFPRMAPFQHFVNVISAVFLGPFGAVCCAALTGGMRMLLNGSTILAVTGAVFGAGLSGILYRKTGRLFMAVIGEIIGTGIISAIVSFPIMKIFYGLPDVSPFTYIPFFIPSSAMGALLAFLFLKAVSRRMSVADMRAKLIGKEKEQIHV